MDFRGHNCKFAAPVHLSARYRHVIGTFPALLIVCWHVVGTHIMLRNVLSSTGGAQLISIDIDTQINFAANKFWFSKTIGLDFSHDAWNTAAPVFDEIQK